jgi:hypothetical protein
MIKLLIKILTFNRNNKMDLNREEALKRLDALDDARKELDKEAKRLREIIETPQAKVEDINSYEDACKILGKRIRKSSEYEDESEWINHQLSTIIEAANFIDNGGKKWKADFLDTSIPKYLPYWEKKSSGWVLGYVRCYGCYSYFAVGFYYKKEKTAQLIATKFSKLYNSWLG